MPLSFPSLNDSSRLPQDCEGSGAVLVVGYALADAVGALNLGDLALLGALVVTPLGDAMGG